MEQFMWVNYDRPAKEKLRKSKQWAQMLTTVHESISLDLEYVLEQPKAIVGGQFEAVQSSGYLHWDLFFPESPEGTVWYGFCYSVDEARLNMAQ